MQFHYFEMDGAGNRILVIDERRTGRAPPAHDVVRRLGNSATGPGFDQMMWVLPPRSDEAAASYRVFNRDGSEVEQCGNGVRCVARILGEDTGATRLRLDSPAGPIEARVRADGTVSVDMGRPEFEPENVPFIAENAANVYQIDVDGDIVDAGVVSMGNPHCVLVVPAVGAAPLARLGPALEHHPRFPRRTNVGFMAIGGRDRIDLRVHERGVGETLACGTGACAAVAIGRRRGELDGDVRVTLPGGQLMVSWPQPADTVWLTGNAELIREGSMDL